MQSATGLLLSLLTYPLVFVVLAVALLFVVVPVKPRAPEDYGRGAALVTYLFVASAWGGILYGSILAVLFLLPFLLLASAGGFVAYRFTSDFVRAAREMGETPKAGTAGTDRAEAHFVGAILACAASIGGMIVGAILPQTTAIEHSVAPALATTVAFAVLAFMYLDLSGSRWLRRLGIGYVAVAVLSAVLTGGLIWRHALALDVAIESVVPHQFHQVGHTRISVLVADNCERDASGEWETGATFTEAIAAVETQLHEEGWTGTLKPYDPNSPFLLTGWFSRQSDVHFLNVHLLQSDYAQKVRDLPYGGLGSPEQVAKLASEFDPGASGRIHLKLLAATKDSCTQP
jgi:hypothetical protein